MGDRAVMVTGAWLMCEAEDCGHEVVRWGPDCTEEARDASVAAGWVTTADGRDYCPAHIGSAVPKSRTPCDSRSAAISA